MNHSSRPLQFGNYAAVPAKDWTVILHDLGIIAFAWLFAQVMVLLLGLYLSRTPGS